MLVFVTKMLNMHKSKFDARARVQFNAKVNDRTDAVVRLTSGNFELGNSEMKIKQMLQLTALM